ncbi:MAG: 3'-5' exonuclease [Saprospiraceae bacterium]|nr:3'-5' exonuclease [Saprospiraceae bacterium]
MIWNGFKNFFGQPQKDWATWYNEYQKTYHPPDKNVLLSTLSYVVLDTETTGLDLKTDQIITLGAVRIQNQEIPVHNVLSCSIRQNILHKQDAVSIHGLVQTEKKGVPAHEALAMFFAYIQSDIIIGHHIGFDVKMIEKTSLHHGGGTIKNLIIDTSFLAKRLDNPMNPNSLDGKNYSLDVLCKRFDIVTKDRHTALGDAFLTALLFIKLIHLFEKKGIKTLKQLL